MPLNQILQGDCLRVLSDFPSGRIDLVYFDPPFNTGKVHSAANGHYRDCWEDMNSYLDFMRPRIQQMRRVLRSTGSLLLHCDWRTCHHLRLMLDELFGADNFVNHLIWSYGLGGSSPRRFARKHDDILFYSRSEEYYFVPPRIPATSQRMRGLSKKATDVLEIPAINNMANERAGYPTQKPVALLDVLVRACCPSNGLVLDPFCGSGTTLAAAQYSGRRFIGIDCNPAAVKIARKRCAFEPMVRPARARGLRKSKSRPRSGSHSPDRRRG